MDALIIADPGSVKLRALRPTEALEDELERATVMSPDAILRGVVTTNSRVLCVDESTGERRTVQIAYPAEADATASKGSTLAPVGAALLGLSIDQATVWNPWTVGGGASRSLWNGPRWASPTRSRPHEC
jgi:regulator of nucleoside diphosphate kinase